MSLRRALLYLKNPLSSSATATPKCHLSLQHRINFFSTTTSSSASYRQPPFTVSYLTNKCGLTQEAVLKTSKRVHFDSPRKPDSVLAFFTNYGFSKTQIQSIVCKVPELLTCDPTRRLLPKFEFFASKGASHSDILLIVSRNPYLLLKSLENHIVPMYELVRRFFLSDEKAIACVIGNPFQVRDGLVEENVKMLLEEGLTHSNIHHLFRTRPSILCSSDLSDTVKEVKQLGFDPSKGYFSVALLAKRTVSKPKWDAKVEAFKKWGWSEQEIFDTFRRNPLVMLYSKEKINAVLGLWIGQLGWDHSALCMRPTLLGYSLKKRIIPRASVVRYLLSKGLMKKNACLTTPFCLTDKLFLQRFVKCYEDNEISQILKLYQAAR